MHWFAILNPPIGCSLISIHLYRTQHIAEVVFLIWNELHAAMQNYGNICPRVLFKYALSNFLRGTLEYAENVTKSQTEVLRYIILGNLFHISAICNERNDFANAYAGVAKYFCTSMASLRGKPWMLPVDVKPIIIIISLCTHWVLCNYSVKLTS